jgi:hypothetical protein
MDTNGHQWDGDERRRQWFGFVVQWACADDATAQTTPTFIRVYSCPFVVELNRYSNALFSNR